MAREPSTKYLDCIAACNACLVACQHCAASCLQEPDVKKMARCIALDMDCAQLCATAVALMAGASEFAGPLCTLCAQACRACEQECGKHDMDHCKQCAEACHRCADACDRMVAG